MAKQFSGPLLLNNISHDESLCLVNRYIKLPTGIGISYAQIHLIKMSLLTADNQQAELFHASLLARVSHPPTALPALVSFVLVVEE